jgi:hypothetical protein
MTSSVQTSQVAYISRAGDFSGNSFIKTGGTSSQFLKADGSVDSTAYGTGSVTSVATSAPLTGGTITTSGTIGITQATTSTNGYLSSTDWNTFNNKLSTATAASTYVPYSGATANLEMGNGSLGIQAGKFILFNRAGSNTLGAGAYQGFVDAAQSNGVYFQLNASNNLAIFGRISGADTQLGFISASGSFNFNSFIPTGSTVPTNGMYLSAANTLNFATNSTNRLSISSTGAATFSSSVTATSVNVVYNNTLTGQTADNVTLATYTAGASNELLQITIVLTNANATGQVRSTFNYTDDENHSVSTAAVATTPNAAYGVGQAVIALNIKASTTLTVKSLITVGAIEYNCRVAITKIL